ncbi:MAG: M48 family metallopeptidase [Candidatus Nanoarchaeia archaeon]
MERRVSFYDQISSNKWKSFFLIFVVIIVLLTLGYVIGLALGQDYLIIVMFFTVLFTSIYVLVGYFASDKIAIASVGAKEAKFEEYRQYHHIVEGLSLAAGLPKPRLYVMEDDDINAFASGRDPRHSVICVTTAALEKLNKQELEGVLAHEMSHIGNYDIRYMTLAAVLVGMVAMISHIFLRSLFYGGSGGKSNDKNNAIFIVIGILLAILAPIFANLVQLAISRKREYAADATAVKITRSPTGLISAFEKLRNNPSTPHAKITKAVAPLFISDPFKHNRKADSWLSTHPTLDNRIAILKRM